jgi:16S rRNA (adenine1518-N6/adenine1519-N6)-dimethyltransferase
MEKARKALGQHWLKDDVILSKIADAGQINTKDTVLEIGPGHGYLTKHLVKKANQVVAVEIDRHLASGLASHFRIPNLQVVRSDILKFDLSQLPKGYKVIANIPYYLTGHLLRRLSSAPNPPSSMVLLVQKEVAERIVAQPGKMSALAVGVQLHYEAKLDQIVPAKMFIPPPKVDSQVVILKRRARPLFKDLDEKQFFQVVRAGFSNPRKKLRSSLSAGLQISKPQADRLLEQADINGDLRPESLSLQQWHSLYLQFHIKNDLRSLLRSNT